MAKRRGNNEGTVYKHKFSGKWYAQISLDGRRHGKYFHTQKECHEWLKEINLQKDQGLTFSAARLNVSDYFQRWGKNIEHTVSPKTWIRYEQIARDHIVPTLGKIKLKDLRPDQIQSLYSRKLEEGQSNRSVRYIHSTLRKALNDAIVWGLINRNPALVIKPPKLQKKEMEYLTAEQAKILLSAVENTRYAALYHLAVATGLRLGELLGLKWADIEWDNKRLQIRRQVQRIPHVGLIFAELKTKHSERVINLGGLTIEKLKAHKEIQQDLKYSKGEIWQENDLLFPSTKGKLQEPRNLQRHFKNLLERIGLPKIRFHDLRHTAATLMFSQGVNAKVISERLGHHSTSFTLDTYSHVIPSMQSQAADDLDAILQ